MSLDSRERFSATVDNYRRYRPSYPSALFDWLAAEASLAPGARVADVGCGTGISTRLLAQRGWDVVGVDPNAEMLEQARREGGARYARGEASDTGLPAGSFDLVSAAQAYHWFDVPASFAEFRRILRAGGHCAAFWNLRGDGAFMDAYDALLRAHATDYAVLLKPAETIAAVKAQPAAVGVREASFPNSQRLDRDALFGRAYSSSYVVHGLRDKDRFDRALRELHARHAIGGQVEFGYRCVAILWRIE